MEMTFPQMEPIQRKVEPIERWREKLKGNYSDDIMEPAVPEDSPRFLCYY